MPAITALPPVPTRADPSNFAAKADALLSALESPFVPELNALSTDVSTKYDTVLTSTAIAIDAKDVAVASANFKGAWSSLTGALNIPASVSHSGSLWLLTANLADVTTATPGVSGSWMNISNILNGVTTATAARSVLDVYSKSESQSLATNLIDNSNFSINQRGVSGTVTLTAGAYGHDRWKGGASGVTYTFASSNGVTTITISAGSLVQVVDGANLETGDYRLSHGGTAQVRVVGGSYAAGPITVSATAGTNLSLEFGTGTVKQVKLTKGSAATAWVMPTGQIDLLNCQRYCQRYSMPPLKGHVLTPSSIGRMAMILPVVMRAVPTATIIGTLGAYDGAYVTTVTSITNAYNTVSSIELDMNVAGTLLTVSRAASIYNNGGNGALLLTSDL